MIGARDSECGDLSSDRFSYLYPQEKVEFWFTLCHTYPNLLMTLVVMKWGHKLSYSVRVYGSCILMLIALAVIPWIEDTPSDGTPAALYFTMIGVVFTGTVNDPFAR